MLVCIGLRICKLVNLPVAATQHVVATIKLCNSGRRVHCSPLSGWGWCVSWADHEGRFRGATKLKGIKQFAAKDYGLVPIRLDTWGQFVFILADLTRCPAVHPVAHVFPQRLC